MLHYCYRIDEMSQPDEKRTSKLLLECIDKMKKRYMDPQKDKYFATRKVDEQPKLPKSEVSQ